MSALSYGCQSCSTIDTFNGSLQGQHAVLGGNNNSMVNQMIEDSNFNNVGNELIVKNNIQEQIYNADLRQNNYGGNNYNNNNQNQMNPVMNNNTYGNGNNANQHPMNSNYNDVKLPQIVGVPTKTAQPKGKIVPNNNNIIYANNKDIENEKKIGWYFKVGLVFLTALAIHETIKYYINHSIKFNEGSATYFVYYALGCLVAFYVVNNYVKFE